MDAMDCGPSCLRMISKFYGKSYSLQTLRTESGIGKEGVSLYGICEAAEAIGFRTKSAKVSLEKLLHEKPLPCILHWNQGHFVVLYKIKGNKFYVADPARSRVRYSKREFITNWSYVTTPTIQTGVALFVEPTSQFYQKQGEEEKKDISFKLLYNYLFSSWKLLIQLFIGLLIGTILQLLLPFLTQSIVDGGIANQNFNIIYLILIGQIIIMASQTIISFIRSWIILHISTRINMNILSDFIFKLMKLPATFFESRLTGDILQRIGDHKRIELFLTGSTLNILFSTFNIIIFSIVLGFYNLNIFLLFFIASIMYVGWLLMFLKKRSELDYKNFNLSSKSNNQIIQIIKGMPEIKLSGSERYMRWEWEGTQVNIFRLEILNLTLSQVQETGAFLINQLKNIFIIYISAKAVIEGHLTLGAMLAIQIIIGELNGPIQQLMQLVQTVQNAKISLERLNEIYSLEDENKTEQYKLDFIPASKNIELISLSFSYPGAGNVPIFEDINLTIPEGKTTAIVGSSGSGKTTLLKLLLNFYEPSKGEIRVGGVNLTNIKQKIWRGKCGAVLQEGFIFSGTVATNIAVGEENINIERLRNAIRIANIEEFIDSLPFGIHAKIGDEGNGISQGQKQRILIARAVYKNPDFILFDEATNSLDANNETKIIENLEAFFKGRTVVIVAHRLSTVKKADQIVVLEKGKIVESGNHAELVLRKGVYYQLIINQLEKVA